MAAAAYYYLAGNVEYVFVAAALGSLCFFIGIRFQVKERIRERAEEADQEKLLDRGYPEATARKREAAAVKAEPAD